MNYQHLLLASRLRTAADTIEEELPNLLYYDPEVGGKPTHLCAEGLVQVNDVLDALRTAAAVLETGADYAHPFLRDAQRGPSLSSVSDVAS